MTGDDRAVEQFDPRIPGLESVLSHGGTFCCPDEA